MPLPDLDPPILVEDKIGLERLLKDLAGQDEIAVDTEADSFYSYREKVCLIQVTVEDRDYLLDPLAGLDLDAFGEIIADPTKTKVFHDAEYDVLIMKRALGWSFANLFDTRVAAAVIGMEAPGLASVLEDRFGVELDKSMQRSDWAKRPLEERQIQYARLDTHYLLPLMADLKRSLAKSGRGMIVEAECRRLEQLEPAPVVFNPDEFVKIKGARTLSPIERGVLKELYALRERLSSDWDSPPFRVMNNPLLLQLAQDRPRGARRLGTVRGFSQRLVRKIGDQVLEAIERGLAAGPLERLPSLPKKDGTAGLSEVEADLFERLKKWRRGVAEEEGIESSYLLNRHVMSRIAKQRPRGEALRDIDGFLDWQFERYGRQVMKLVETFEKAVARGEVPPKRSWKRR